MSQLTQELRQQIEEQTKPWVKPGFSPHPLNFSTFLVDFPLSIILYVGPSGSPIHPGLDLPLLGSQIKTQTMQNVVRVKTLGTKNEKLQEYTISSQFPCNNNCSYQTLSFQEQTGRRAAYNIDKMAQPQYKVQTPQRATHQTKFTAPTGQHIMKIMVSK